MKLSILNQYVVHSQKKKKKSICCKLCKFRRKNSNRSKENDFKKKLVYIWLLILAFFYLYKITLFSPNNIIDSFKSNTEKN